MGRRASGTVDGEIERDALMARKRLRAPLLHGSILERGGRERRVEVRVSGVQPSKVSRPSS